MDRRGHTLAGLLAGAGPLRPGTVTVLQVVHNGGCDTLRGLGRCTCPQWAGGSRKRQRSVA